MSGTHCDHWWDGEEDAEGNLIPLPCCWCGDNTEEPADTSDEAALAHQTCPNSEDDL